jgi:RNA polymerase sigma-70 factor (ECF subfamily)
MPLRTVTHTTLLEGLKDPRNETLWSEYVGRYRPLVVAYCARLGLAPADADDVAQEALLAFARRYREGAYDRERGRLRSWLFGIVRTSALHWHQQQARRREAAPGERVAADPVLLDQLPAEDVMSALWEQEWRDAVVAQCLAEARAAVEPKTFAAFELFVREGWPAARVAAHLGMTANAVFLAKHRVLRFLRETQPAVEEVW